MRIKSFFVLCPKNKPNMYFMQIDQTGYPRWALMITDAMKWDTYKDADAYRATYLKPTIDVVIVEVVKLPSNDDMSSVEEAYDRAMGVI